MDYSEQLIGTGCSRKRSRPKIK